MLNNKIFSKLCNSLVRFICSSFGILVFCLLGVLCGIFFPEFSKKLSLGGEIYINYITLLTIPLIICALSSSIATLIRQNRDKQNSISLKKLFGLQICTLLMISFIGIFSEITVNYFFPNQINVERLDEIFHAREKVQADYSIRIFEEPKKNMQKQFVLREFVLESLPTNIFQSLSHGDFLHILIFSILFGCGLGIIPSEQSQSVINILSSTYQTCLFLIQCSIYVLPICLFCLLSNMISLLDCSTLKIFSQYMLVILVLELFFVVLGFFLWCRIFRMSPRTSLKTVGKTMLLALSSCQRFVVMPMLMQDMEKKMHYPAAQLKLVVPFAFTMGRYMQTLVMTVTAVFVSYIYYGTLSLSMFFMILIITPLIAIGGAWPIVTAPCLRILGLPYELGLLLVLTINPFVDPFLTLNNVTYNALFSALNMKRTYPVSQEKQAESAGNDIG